MQRFIFSFLFLHLISIFTSSSQQIAAGGFHSLFVCENGTIKAAGSNYSGQLGNTSISNLSTTPVIVFGMSNVKMVAAGSYFSLALKNDSTVWAWGINNYGQLGDGTLINRSTPVQVPNLTGVVKIDAGLRHSVALKADGTVWCWGDNNDDQLGIGSSSSNSLVPIQVPLLNGITDIASKAVHSLALKSDSTVMAWGDNTTAPVLGVLSSTNTFGRPVQCGAIDSVVEISCGWLHSIVRKADGTIWNWGSNYNGELGRGYTSGGHHIPGRVFIDSVIQLGGGYVHTSIIKQDGTVWTWGRNSRGELGRITSGFNDSIPRKVPSINNATFSDGYYNTLVLKADSSVWGSGWNVDGQLGIGSPTVNNFSMHKSLTLCNVIPDVSIITSSYSVPFKYNQSIVTYPNPFKDELNVKWTTNEKSGYKILELYNSNYQKIESYNIENIIGQIRINRSGLPSGLYFVTLKGNDSAAPITKLVVAK